MTENPCVNGVIIHYRASLTLVQYQIYKDNIDMSVISFYAKNVACTHKYRVAKGEVLLVDFLYQILSEIWKKKVARIKRPNRV